MRFRRKKGDEEEVVSGDVMPEAPVDPSSWTLPVDAAVTAGEEAQDDTLDMEAVAPATAAGGASRADDHGEKTVDDSTTVLEQATGEVDPDATVEHHVAEAPAAAGLSGSAGEEADRKAEAARLADEEATRAAKAEAEARKAEEQTRKAEEKSRREADAAEKARAEAEQKAKEQREADETARAEAEAARAERAAAAASTSVSGASVTSPGLGSEASPAAAAAANASEPERPAAPSGGSGDVPAVEGPLAPVLGHPAVQQKPELLVVGGLAAGFVVAKILKAITSPDE